MFRTALLRSARGAMTQIARNSGAIARPVAPSSLFANSRFAPSVFQAARCYSAAASLQKPEVEGRIVDLLKNFDKVSAVPALFGGCVDISPGYRSNEGILQLKIVPKDPLLTETAYAEFPLCKRSWFGQSGHGRGCDGYRGGWSSGME